MCSKALSDMYGGNWVGAEDAGIVIGQVHLIKRVNRKLISGGRDYGISSLLFNNFNAGQLCNHFFEYPGKSHFQ